MSHIFLLENWSSHSTSVDVVERRFIQSTVMAPAFGSLTSSPISPGTGLRHLAIRTKRPEAPSMTTPLHAFRVFADQPWLPHLTSSSASALALYVLLHDVHFSVKRLKTLAQWNHSIFSPYKIYVAIAARRLLQSCSWFLRLSMWRLSINLLATYRFLWSWLIQHFGLYWWTILYRFLKNDQNFVTGLAGLNHIEPVTTWSK